MKSVFYTDDILDAAIEQNKDYIKNASALYENIPLEDIILDAYADKYVKGKQTAMEVLEREAQGVKGLQYAPFAGPIYKAIEYTQLKRAIERLSDDQYPQDNEGIFQKARDLNAVEEYLRSYMADRVRGQTFGAKVATTVAAMPAFMIEMALLRGVGKLASEPVKAGTLALLKNTIGQAAAKGIAQITGAVAESAWLATTGFAPRTIEATMERQVQSAAQLRPQEPLYVSLAKGYGDTFVEILSEQSGEGMQFVGRKALEGLGKVIGKQKLGGKLVQGVYEFWKKTRPKGQFVDFLDEMFAKGRWNGYLAEIGEERLGTILRGALGIEDYGLGPESSIPERIAAGLKQDLENLPVEMVAFAVPGAVKTAAGAIPGQYQKTPYETPVGAFDLMKKAPEDWVRRMLGTDAPSRKDFAEIGLTGLSASQRKTIVDLFRRFQTQWEDYLKQKAKAPAQPTPAEQRRQRTMQLLDERERLIEEAKKSGAGARQYQRLIEQIDQELYRQGYNPAHLPTIAEALGQAEPKKVPLWRKTRQQVEIDTARATGNDPKAIQAALKQHEQEVRKAIRLGKNVPKEVLADYEQPPAASEVPPASSGTSILPSEQGQPQVSTAPVLTTPPEEQPPAETQPEPKPEVQPEPTPVTAPEVQPPDEQPTPAKEKQPYIRFKPEYVEDIPEIEPAKTEDEMIANAGKAVGRPLTETEKQLAKEVFAKRTSRIEGKLLNNKEEIGEDLVWALYRHAKETGNETASELASVLLEWQGEKGEFEKKLVIPLKKKDFSVKPAKTKASVLKVLKDALPKAGEISVAKGGKTFDKIYVNEEGRISATNGKELIVIHPHHSLDIPKNVFIDKKNQTEPADKAKYVDIDPYITASGKPLAAMEIPDAQEIANILRHTVSAEDKTVYLETETGRYEMDADVLADLIESTIRLSGLEAKTPQIRLVMATLPSAARLMRVETFLHGQKPLVQTAAMLTKLEKASEWKETISLHKLLNIPMPPQAFARRESMQKERRAFAQNIYDAALQVYEAAKLETFSPERQKVMSEIGNKIKAFYQQARKYKDETPLSMAITELDLAVKGNSVIDDEWLNRIRQYTQPAVAERAKSILQYTPEQLIEALKAKEGFSSVLAPVDWLLSEEFRGKEPEETWRRRRWTIEDVEKAAKKQKGKLDDFIHLVGGTGVRTKEELDAIKESIEKGGYFRNEPIIIGYNRESDSFYVSDGTHRLMLAKELGLEYVPIAATTIVTEKGRGLPERLLQMAKAFERKRYSAPIETMKTVIDHLEKMKSLLDSLKTAKTAKDRKAISDQYFDLWTEAERILKPYKTMVKSELDFLRTVFINARDEVRKDRDFFAGYEQIHNRAIEQAKQFIQEHEAKIPAQLKEPEPQAQPSEEQPTAPKLVEQKATDIPNDPWAWIDSIGREQKPTEGEQAMAVALPKPKPYRETLDRIQAEGVGLMLKAVLNKRSFLLADGTGVGKTRQELAVAYETALRTGKPSLIVTQNRQIIKGSFTDDATAMGIPLDTPMMRIITYSDLKDPALHRVQWGVVIFDEAHNLKNTDAQKTVNAAKLKTDAKVFATATPLDRPTGAEYFLSEITGIPIPEIRQRLGYEIRMRVVRDRNGEVVEEVPVAVPLPGEDWGKIHKNMLAMRDEAIKNGQMVRREYLFLGEINEKHITVSPDIKKMEAKIDGYWSTIIENTANRYVRRNAAAQRLREISWITEHEKAKQIAPEIVKSAKEGKKIIVVIEQINESELKGLGKQKIGPSSAIIGKALDEANIPYSKCYGIYDKAYEIERFQKGQTNVLLMTPQSGGTGVNLDDTVGNAPRTMYILTPNYSGDVIEQIIGRVSRRNTKSASTVIYMTSDTFSDRRRRTLVLRKMQMLKAIQRGVDHDEAGGLITDDGIYDPTQKRLVKVDSADIEYLFTAPEAELAMDEEPVAEGPSARQQYIQSPGPTAQHGFMEVQLEEARQTGKRTRQISAEAIIRWAEKTFGVPRRIGRIRKKALGIFKTYPHVIRMKRKGSTDLAVFSHELAHFLDAKYDLTPKAPDYVQEELRKLDYQPALARVNEGFAEFVRVYISGDDVHILAPQAFAWFTQFLDAHPDVKAKVAQLRDYVSEWRAQGALNRVKSHISFNGTTQLPEGESVLGWLKEQLHEFLVFLYERFIDDTYYLRRFNNIAKQLGLKKETVWSAEIALAMNQIGPTLARTALEKGVYTLTLNNQTRIGPSLKEVLSKIKPEQYEDFCAYVYARHAIEAWKMDHNPGISLADANKVIQDLKTPEFEEAAQGLTQYNNALLDMLVWSGVVSPQSAENMKKVWTTYVPLMRLRDADTIAAKLGFSRRRLANLPPVIKRRKLGGAGDVVIDPIAMTVQRTIMFYERAAKQLVINELVRESIGVRGLGKYIELVIPLQKPIKFTLDEIKEQLEKIGIKIPEDDPNIKWDEVLFLFRPDYTPPKDKPIVQVMQNGQPKLYQLDPDLYREIMAMDYTQLPPFFEVTFGKLARLVKLFATEINPAFGVKNPIRDYLTFLAQSKAGVKAKLYPLPEGPGGMVASYVATQVNRILGKEGDVIVQLWEEMGGPMATWLGYDIKTLRRQIDDIMADSTKRRLYNIVTHPIDAIREIINISEVGPRLAEFRASLERQGYDKATLEKMWKHGERPPTAVLIRAINDASDVTTNFRRAGVWMRWLNRVIPYINAPIQGTDKFIRTFKEDPQKALLHLGVISSFNIAYWFLVKDEEWYEELPAWMKYGFYVIPIGDRPGILIPRAHLWGVMGAGIEALLNSMQKSNPKEMAEWGKMLYQVTGVPEGVTSILPPGIKESYEVSANWDSFRKRQIVSKSMEMLLPEDQAHPFNLQLSRWIGKQLGYSPAKIEHFLHGITGGGYTRIGGVIERAIRGEKEQMRGPLAVRQDYSVSVREAYDQYEQVSKQYYSAKKKDQLSDELKNQFNRINRQIELLGELRKLGQDIPERHPRFEASEKWVIGLSRHILGKEDSELYPNPLKHYDKAPEPVQKLAKKYLATTLFHATNPRPERQKGESLAAYQERLAEWEAVRQRAITEIKELKLTKPQVMELMMEQFKQKGLKLSINSSAQKRLQAIRQIMKEK